jgi:phage virion morphogenesis protein
MDELSALEDWAGALLAKLEPAARRQAAVDIARELRRSQQARIASQRNPDGTAFEPRKARQVMKSKKLREKAGRIKRRAMFAKMRTARFFKVETDSSGLAIGFSGRIARLARIHQEGLASEVEAGGPVYQYPIRQLLGFSQAERDLIRDKLLEHLAK